MFAASDIAQMSVEDRLKAIEMLWSSLGSQNESIASPEWHREILAHRVSKIEADEASFLTISEIRSKFLGDK